MSDIFGRGIETCDTIYIPSAPPIDNFTFTDTTEIPIYEIIDNSNETEKMSYIRETELALSIDNVTKTPFNKETDTIIETKSNVEELEEPEIIYTVVLDNIIKYIQENLSSYPFLLYKSNEKYIFVYTCLSNDVSHNVDPKFSENTSLKFKIVNCKKVQIVGIFDMKTAASVVNKVDETMWGDKEYKIGDILTLGDMGHNKNIILNKERHMFYTNIIPAYYTARIFTKEQIGFDTPLSKENPYFSDGLAFVFTLMNDNTLYVRQKYRIRFGKKHGEYELNNFVGRVCFSWDDHYNLRDESDDHVIPEHNSEILNKILQDERILNINTKCIELLKANFKNGVLDHKYEAFHGNGKKLCECFFSNGKIDGRYIKYNQKGTIVYDGVFNEGIKNGIHTFAMGNPYSPPSFSFSFSYLNDVLNGPCKYYYMWKNKVTYAEVTFKNGLLDGKCIFKNSSCLKEETYVNGIIHGTQYIHMFSPFLKLIVKKPQRLYGNLEEDDLIKFQQGNKFPHFKKFVEQTTKTSKVDIKPGERYYITEFVNGQKTEKYIAEYFCWTYNTMLKYVSHCLFSTNKIYDLLNVGNKIFGDNTRVFVFGDNTRVFVHETTVNYVDDKLNGEIVRCSMGTKTIENYVNGVKHGVVSHYFLPPNTSSKLPTQQIDNNFLIFAGNYVNNKLEGEAKYYHLNGVPKSHVVYSNNRIVKTIHEWNSDGTLKKSFFASFFGSIFGGCM